MPKPHRIVYTQADDGRWTFAVFAGNNWKVDQSDKAYRSKWWIQRKARKQWPGSTERWVPRVPR